MEFRGHAAFYIHRMSRHWVLSLAFIYTYIYLRSIRQFKGRNGDLSQDFGIRSTFHQTQCEHHPKGIQASPPDEL